VSRARGISVLGGSDWQARRGGGPTRPGVVASPGPSRFSLRGSIASSATLDAPRERLMVSFVTTRQLGSSRRVNLPSDSSRHIGAVGGQNLPGSRQWLNSRGDQVTLEIAPANTRN
jgi:hypothetical protein